MANYNRRSYRSGTITTSNKYRRKGNSIICIDTITSKITITIFITEQSARKEYSRLTAVRR